MEHYLIMDDMGNPVDVPEDRLKDFDPAASTGRRPLSESERRIVDELFRRITGREPPSSAGGR